MAYRYLRQGRVRWLLVVAAAFAVAWGAAWLLRSPDSILPVTPTAVEDWFAPQELSRMLEFRGPQRLLGLAGLLVELIVLAALAWWATPRLTRFWPRHPLLGAAAVGVGLSLVITIVSLPFGLIALERAIDFGLSTQSLSDWLWDRARGAAIAALMAGLGAMLALLIIRRLGRHWWLGGTVLVAAYAIFVTWLAPLVIAPAFNRFDPLPEGPAREEIAELANLAGVEVSDILVVDAGSRSKAINAYVTGLGSSRRVVVYDNALNDLRRPELRAILAHELSHVKGRDVQRGVIWVILVAPLGVLALQGASTALVRRRGGQMTTPAAIPVLALCLSLAVLTLGIPGRDLSRQLEARADTFALELTDEPAAFIKLQRRLAERNLSNPDPSSVWDFVFASHPSTVERIGAALTYQRERRSDAADQLPGG